MQNYLKLIIPNIDVNINNATHKEELKFDEYISQSIGYNSVVDRLFNCDYAHSMGLWANANSGKSYSLIQSAYFKLKEYNKDVINTIMAFVVPTRMQALQLEKDGVYVDDNGKSVKVKVKALVGGAKLEQGDDIIVLVSDMADDVLAYAKSLKANVVLVIDEAHLIISQKSFRYEAIMKLKKLAEYSKSVCYMTATAESVKSTKKIDYIYDFKTSKSKSEDMKIKHFEIRNTTDYQRTLFLAIEDAIKRDKIPFVKLDSILHIQKLKELCEKTGYRCAFLASENTNKEYKKYITKDVIEGIQDEGKIIEGYDIVFCTTVLEQGTSIREERLEAIVGVSDCMRFSEDGTVQIFARPRKLIDKGILVIKRKADFELNKDVKEVKNLQWYVDSLKSLAIRGMEFIREDVTRSLEMSIDNIETREILVNRINKKIKLAREKKEADYGFLKFDYVGANKEFTCSNYYAKYFDCSDFVLELDVDLLVSKAIQLRDTFNIYNPGNLEKIFEGKIRYGSITQTLDDFSLDNGTYDDLIKQDSDNNELEMSENEIEARALECINNKKFRDRYLLPYMIIDLGCNYPVIKKRLNDIGQITDSPHVTRQFSEEVKSLLGVITLSEAYKRLDRLLCSGLDIDNSIKVVNLKNKDIGKREKGNEPISSKAMSKIYKFLNILDRNSIEERGLVRQVNEEKTKEDKLYNQVRTTVDKYRKNNKRIRLSKKLSLEVYFELVRLKIFNSKADTLVYNEFCDIVKEHGKINIADKAIISRVASVLSKSQKANALMRANREIACIYSIGSDIINGLNTDFQLDKAIQLMF